MKKKKFEISLIELNVCRLPGCNCGANIKIGVAYKDYEKLRTMLDENCTIFDLRGKKDVRNHKN